MVDLIVDKQIDACRYCGTKGRQPTKRELTTHEGNQVIRYAVWCSKCGCDGPLAYNESEAIELWNGKLLRGTNSSYLHEVLVLIDKATIVAKSESTKEALNELRDSILNSKW